MPLKTDVPEPSLRPVQDMQISAELLCMFKLHLGLLLLTEAPAVTFKWHGMESSFPFFAFALLHLINFVKAAEWFNVGNV